MTRPLGDTIRDHFEAQILSGALAPGTRLPTEQAIMAKFGCSRMTVSKALSELTRAGLIERRKRAGTFVARPRVHSMVLEVPDLAELVAARGQAYAFRLDLREEVSGDPGHLGGRPALHLVGVHFADGTGIAVEDRTVNLAAVPDIRGANLYAEAPGTWLLRHVPWTEAETRITAVPASGRDSALLGVSPGAACLCVERRTWRGDDPITRVRQVFRGDSYELAAHFRPGAS